MYIGENRLTIRRLGFLLHYIGHIYNSYTCNLLLKGKCLILVALNTVELKILLTLMISSLRYLQLI